MQLKFSLKWLLIAVAYVALAVAAYRFHAALWTVALFSVSAVVWLFVLVVTFYRSGTTRAAAVGFVVWTAAYAVLVMVKPSLAPTTPIAEMLRVPRVRPVLTTRAVEEANRQRTRALHTVAAITCGLLGSLAAAYLYSTRKVDRGAEP